MPSARAETAPPTLLEKPKTSSPARFSLRGCRDYLVQVTAVTLFIGTGLVVCSLCSLATRLCGDRIPARVGQNLIRRLFHTWLRVCVRLGAFQIDFPEEGKLASLQGAIVAPNHPSLIDAVLLLNTMPRAVCIMRANLMRSPFLGGAARLARFVTNDQGPALIREGIEKIRQGDNLLIFPEGTRTQKQAVNPFKHGFALIAAKTGAPIQTVFIERHGRYLGKGVSLFKPTPMPVRFTLRLGDQFTCREGETPQELSRRLENYFRANLKNTGEDIRRVTRSRP